MKGNKVIVMVLLLLVTTVLVSGCTQEPAKTSPTKTSTITSKEQAAAAVPNALEKTDKALGALQDIKNDLGG